jgi:hypothetical protein
MTDYVYRRQAYKAAREKVRHAMVLETLDAKAIIAIARPVIDADFPEAGVDLEDLVGACLFYQQQLKKG